jgi:hypothetical protein
MLRPYCQGSEYPRPGKTAETSPEMGQVRAQWPLTPGPRMRASDGNRTRTISLGMIAADGPDQSLRRSARTSVAPPVTVNPRIRRPGHAAGTRLVPLDTAICSLRDRFGLLPRLLPTGCTRKAPGWTISLGMSATRRLDQPHPRSSHVLVVPRVNVKHHPRHCGSFRRSATPGRYWVSCYT